MERNYTLEGLRACEVRTELGRDILFLPGLSRVRFVELGLAGYGLELKQVLVQSSLEVLAVA